MEFKWTISKVQVIENNLINLVSLIVTGIDGEHAASASYSRYLNQSDSFIPYEQLTEQQVLDWCFAPEIITLEDQTTVTKLLRDEGEAQITGQIARQLAQKQSEPALPWQN